MIPKSSSRFIQRNNDMRRNAKDDNHISSNYLGLSDWRLDFFLLEDNLLIQYQNSKKCLMLLKYFAFWHRNFTVKDDKHSSEKGIWSYYLKTVVMRTILENPSRDFWRNTSLFKAFLLYLESSVIFKFH